MDLTDPSETLLTRWREQRETPPEDRRYGGWRLLALADDGTELGLAALAVSDADATAALAELWMDPDHRRRGHGRRALTRIEAHCRERGAVKLVASTPPGPATARLFADWTITSRHMELDVTAEPEQPSDVITAPMTAEDFGEWRRHNLHGYAESLATAGNIPFEAALAAAERQFVQLLPRGIDTPDHEFWELRADGAKVADLWVHVNRSEGNVFIFKVEADSAHRGKGYGRAATRLAESRALANGLDRVKLHVFADNVTANGLYDGLGYRVTREHRRKRL